MKKLNGIKEEGITLAALVITIIILLIIARVSINFLGYNGLFERAKKVTNEYKK